MASVEYKIKVRFTFWFYYILYGAKLLSFTKSKKVLNHFENIVKTKELVKVIND